MVNLIVTGLCMPGVLPAGGDLVPADLAPGVMVNGIRAKTEAEFAIHPDLTGMAA